MPSTIGNDTINITEADVATLNALGGTDTLNARTAIKTLNMTTAEAEIFRGLATAVVGVTDYADIVVTSGATAVKLYGFLGNDQLSGGGGKDVLDGGVGNDTLDGGAEADTLTGGAGYDQLRGGDGNDLLYIDIDDLTGDVANSIAAVVEGGTGVDKAILATGTVDVVIANLTGLSIESLTLSGGNDEVTVTSGNSTILGMAGHDQLTGGSNNDSLDGGIGDDVLVGGTGIDTLVGGAGLDDLAGGAGNDRLDGGADSDTLAGGADADTLAGGAGADELHGEAGNDLLQIDSADTAFTGGADTDRLQWVDTTAGANFTLANNAGFEFFTTSTTLVQNDTIDASVNGAGIDIRTGLGNDTIIGSNFAGALVSGSNDVLDGGVGDDSILGGAGADRIYGREGADHLEGGGGDDVVYFDSADTVVEGGSGTDFATAQLSLAGVDFDMGATSFERATGSNFADTIQGGTGSDSISGGSGADSLVGGDGNDVLDGGSANDLLDGVDTLIGGAGNDTIYGGAGTDQTRLSGNFSDYTFVNIAAGSVSNGLKGLAGVRVTHTSSGSIDYIANNADLMVFDDRSATISSNNLTVAVNDTASVDEGATLNGSTVLVNDFDADIAFGRQTLSNLTVSLVIGPANAAAFTLNANGTYTYTPTSGYSGPDSFTYQVNDTFGNSNSATVSITVNNANDAPVANANGGSLSYTENGSAAAVNSLLTLSDADTTNLTGATVTITGNFATGQDVLGLANQNGITGVYNPTTGELTLSGSSSVANYQTALRSVTYANTSDNPSTAQRTVSFQVDDGEATNHASNVVTSTVSVAAVNDAPVANANGGSLSYTENGSATAVNSLLTLSDADSTSLTGATVTITGNFATGQDVLAFTDQNGITGSYNATTGELTLSGSSSVANYQTALRSVTYANTSDNPSTALRTVSFQVDDGQALDHASNVVTSTVSLAAVNDAPVANANGGSLSYTENQAAAAINTLLTLSDADTINLTGATVTITGNFATGQDVLGFTNQNGITGTYNATNGTLTLSGAASVANYQTALRSVTYANTSENPSTLQRTISFQVDDGQAANNASNTATSTVSVAATNDAPTSFAFVADSNTIVSGNGTGNIGSGQALGLFTGADPDNASLTFSLSGTNASSFTIGSTTGIIAAGGSNLSGGTSYDLNVDLSDGTTTTSFALHVEVLSTGSNSYTGTTNTDLIFGLNGGDTLNGGDGDDVIMGGGAGDSMVGGNGSDQMIGGAAQDTMTGSAGADIFIFGTTAEAGSSLANADSITDFDEGLAGELINLSFIDADDNGGSDTTNNVFAFGGQTTSSTLAVVANSITWYQDTANNRTVIMGDTTGNTTADFFIVLTGSSHTLTASDFVL